LSDSDQQVLQALPPDRREAERIQLAEKTIGPAWFFLVALCHCLQEGENELTAADAYWIGIVDEVYGEPSLWGSRQLAEAAVNASSDSTYSETP
jgi:enoyl-CoA hydratase/carnithine racemase